MFRVFNLRCLAVIALMSLFAQGACGKKDRRDKASTPGLDLAPFVPASWSLDRDWAGSGLKIKDIKP